MSLMACTLTLSCSSDEDNLIGNDAVSPQVLSNIRETFPSLRLDSIYTSSNAEYNLKLTYDGDLLVSYKLCDDNGVIHKGVSYTLEWGRDTIYAKCGTSLYRAAIGQNGCVSVVVCSNGGRKYFEYDSERNLIRYDCDLWSSDEDNYELTWENGNVVTAKRNTTDQNGNPDTITWDYTYSSTVNVDGLLPAAEGIRWINDAGLSSGYGLYEVLYYAGLLGNKSKNLVSSARSKLGNHTSNYSFSYYIDDAGHVTSVYEDWRRTIYYYTE
jgi:hypothetical protein